MVNTPMIDAETIAIDEPITLVSYNSAWPLQYAAEVPTVTRIFVERLCAVEHIGSTAVIGLYAKPIVDILVGVPHLIITSDEFEQLKQHGYQFFGRAGVVGRLYARKRGEVCFNLQIVCHKGALWTNNIAIRDYLRAHVHEAAAYAGMKKQIVSEGICSLVAYAERKHPFMVQLRERALTWY